MSRFHLPKSIVLFTALPVGLSSLSLGTMTSAAGETTTEWKPAPPPAEYVGGPNAVKSFKRYDDVCDKTANITLDCFESIEAFINNVWVKGVKTARANEFKITGLVNDDGKDLVEFQNMINYTGNVFHQVNVFASTHENSKVPWESGETSCQYKQNGLCVHEGFLQKGIKFRVIYTSSWVLPTTMSAKLTQSKTTVEKLAQSGATRVTVEGIPEYFMGAGNDASLTDPKGRGSWAIQHFAISMTDGRFYPIKKECIEKATSTVAENGYGYSMPSFTNGNLALKVSAPHYRPDGKTVHTGMYNAIIPLETAKCLWGDAVQSASQFTIEVFETATGIAKTSTTSVQIRDGAVVIQATGFTFSEPTIKVSYKATATSTSTTAPVVTKAPSTTTVVTQTPTTYVAQVATTPTVKASKSISNAAIAKAVKVTVPQGAKLSVQVAANSAKICKVSGSSVKALKAGTCSVTVTMKPQTGKSVTKKLAIKVAQ